MPSRLDLHPGECLRRGVFPAPRQGRWRGFQRIFFFASLLFCVICTACGAVGYGPPPPVTVNVTPNSAQPFQGEKLQFNATVQNASDSAVNWQVNQTAGGNPTVGMIDSTGLYTAPALVPNPPTVTVTAVLQSDSTKTGSSSVTILALSSITGPLVVSPAISSLTTSQTLQLQVLTPGVGNGDVSWTADGGTITPGGLYTPPSTQGAYTVKASLIANQNAVGTAQVDVTNFPGTLTWRNDNARSGVNSQELALAPATVNSATFGKLFSCSIDGYAYAQPLYVPNLAIPGKGTHNVIFVATENDSVFAFDADSNPCEQLWQDKPYSRGIAGHCFSYLGLDRHQHRAFRGDYRHSCYRCKRVHAIRRCRNADHRVESNLQPHGLRTGLDHWTRRFSRRSRNYPDTECSIRVIVWKTNGPRSSLTMERCTLPLARMADSALGKSRANITAGYSGMTPPRCNKPEPSTSLPTPSREEFGRAGVGRPSIQITTFSW